MGMEENYMPYLSFWSLKRERKSNLIDIIAVTEVQSHDPGSLHLTNYSEFIIHPSDHPLGKKGGGVLFFTKSHLYPKLI